MKRFRRISDRYDCRMMIKHFSRALGLLGLIWGLNAEALAQVPKNPDRIRETTQAILSQPEFRLFPRLNPEDTSSGVSGGPSGQGGSRLKSSRGLPPEWGGQQGEGARNGQGNGQGPDGEARTRFGPNGEPLNAPDGNAGERDNPQNAEEALGKRDEFPEAGGLRKLPEGPGVNPNADPRPAEENNPMPGDPLAENRQKPNGNHPDPEAHPDPFAPDAGFQPQRHRAAKPVDRIKGGNQRTDKNSLPTPRPRERRGSDGGSSLPLPGAAVGTLARIVGAVFHILAWAILTMICGMILWLIVKAIRERERPLAFARGAEGTELLELEPAQAPGDFPADVYVAQALRLAEEGRYKEAVVQLVLGAMSRVERAGWVRFRRGMTVRDYLRGIDNRPAAHQGFHSMIRVFEPVAFGRREPTRLHFDQSLKGYELGFGLD
jgi:hypothetical protein